MKDQEHEEKRGALREAIHTELNNKYLRESSETKENLENAFKTLKSQQVQVHQMFLSTPSPD